MKKKYAKPSTLVLVFLTSLFLFLTIPPILLSSPIVSSFLESLGILNAKAHMLILNKMGIESMAASNLLYLSSGSIVEYSAFCFGFLTIGAFILLTFVVPSIGWVGKLKWIGGASALLLTINQGRILLELLLASKWPSWLSTIDRLLYPLLPLVALMIWYQGLKSREHLFSIEESSYVRG